VDKKEVDKAILACETELTLLHESVEEVDVLLGSSKSDVDELNRLTGVKADFISKINEYEKLLNDVNFVANALYENTPLPSDTKFGEVINEYKVISEALELYRSSIVSSLNSKGIVIPSDTKLGDVPENILKLPTLGGDLAINLPNVGSMIDTKDQEYDVTSININSISYPNPQNTILVWSKNINNSVVRSVAVDKNGFVYTCYDDTTVKKLNADGEEVWSYNGHTNVVYSVAVDDNGYVYSGSLDKTVRKISPDGEEVWINSYTRTVHSVAVDKNGFVYSGSANGYIRKTSPEGNTVWSYNVGGVIWSVAVDDSGFVYGGNTGGQIIKLTPDNGVVFTRKQFTDYVNCIFIDEIGYIYACSDDRIVKKLDTSGEEVWRFVDHTNVVYSVVADNNGFVYSGSRDEFVIKFKDNYSAQYEMDLKRR